MSSDILNQLKESLKSAQGTLEDVEDDDDDEEEDEGQGVKPDVQLGFIGDERNLLFLDKNWKGWDGGRVGGKPVWLDTTNPPLPEQVACKQCGDPMMFLLQIYCPLDTPISAFHRALYVFCCKKAMCVAGGNIICLRSQLGRINSLYPETPVSSSSSESTAAEEPHSTLCSLCIVCGCRAPNRCSSCKTAAYCSKLHQKLDWKRHKHACNSEGCAADAPKRAVPEPDDIKWSFPEYSLNVEPEEFDDIELDATTSIWEDAVTAGGKDEEDDAKLTQADYDNALGSETSDPAYIRFLTRVKAGGTEQVLRYCRWDRHPGAGPLAISSAIARSQFQPQPCEHCGAQRAFECQIMPQLLHFLRIEKQTKFAPSAEAARLLQRETEHEDQVFRNALNEDIDWGTIDVFTCTGSCQRSEGTASAEVVRIQPPISIDRSHKVARVVDA